MTNISAIGIIAKDFGSAELCFCIVFWAVVLTTLIIKLSIDFKTFKEIERIKAGWKTGTEQMEQIKSCAKANRKRQKQSPDRKEAKNG